MGREGFLAEKVQVSVGPLGVARGLWAWKGLGTA